MSFGLGFFGGATALTADSNSFHASRCISTDSASFRFTRLGFVSAMPKQISISLKLDPLKLDSKGDLARHFPIIISQWTDVEDELAILFAAALGTEPAKAVTVLRRVNAIYTRLGMIRDGYWHDLFAARLFQKEFDEEIRKCSNVRAEIVHSHWSTDDSYPDCLIRTAGLSDRQLKQFAYDEQDFLEIQIRLGQLTLDLKQFSQFLLSGQLSEEAKLPYWRRSAPS